MNEAHIAEVERTLLYVSEARARAERAHRKLEADKAEAHLTEALLESQRVLAAEHTRLMQATYFAVPTEHRSTALEIRRARS